MFPFYSYPEPVQYKINQRTLGLQKFTSLGENIIIWLFPFSQNQSFIQLLLSQKKEQTRDSLACFLLKLLTQSVHLGDLAAGTLTIIFHLPLFMALQLHAAFLL